jgi:5'-AMP-activated protein kinase regulatory beta subunit
MKMARKIRIERNVTFAYLAPEAQQVALAGCFTNWGQTPVNLKKRKGGLWETTVALPPGTYQYRLLVDGQWRDDPQCAARVANPFGTENCVRTVA